jgi:hypothetical protein
MGIASIVLNLPNLFAGIASKVLPVGTPNQSTTGTLASATSHGGSGDFVAIATDTLGSIDFALDGTPVGATAVFESTSDGGTTWIATKAYQKGGAGVAGSTTATAAGVYNVTTGGAQQVRVRLTTITSGSFTVTANGTVAAAHVGVKNGNAADLNATVVSAGSVGQDHSANQPALPVVGQPFAAAGPYASYVLIATVPGSPSRNNVDIENTSGAQIAVVRDDGTAASGAAPANASVFALGGGSAAGAQGGAWSSQTFKGRLQIYAPSSTAIVSVMVD